jgi:hypothetical protein
MSAGDRVAAGLIETDSGYQLLFLQVHVPTPPEASDITPEEKMRNEAALEQHATLQEHAAKSAACTGS